MKKLTAMFLSLLMCFSLLATTAHADCPPDDPDNPGTYNTGEAPTDPGDGDEDPDEPGNSVLREFNWPKPVDSEPRD